MVCKEKFTRKKLPKRIRYFRHSFIRDWPIRCFSPLSGGSGFSGTSHRDARNEANLGIFAFALLHILDIEYLLVCLSGIRHKKVSLPRKTNLYVESYFNILGLYTAVLHKSLQSLTHHIMILSHHHPKNLVLA